MKSALIIIDVQSDFLQGGALAVPNSHEIMHPLRSMVKDYDTIVLTADWHPANHKSFASNHQGAEPFSTIQMPYGEQVLWPDHCIQGTYGAMIDLPSDIVTKANLIIRKGTNPEIDSYSAFLENDRKTQTGLAGYLSSLNIKHITLAGLALDYCVAYTALDGRAAGFEVTVALDACRGISQNSVDLQVEVMKKAGAALV